MNITTTIDGAKATMSVDGKLTVATSPELENEISNLPETVKEFDLDLVGLDYISSAGLRVLVATQKLAERRGGTMVIRHPSDEVYDIFDMPGLADVFTLER